MKKSLIALSITALVSACSMTASGTNSQESAKQTPKNIIMVVADGMGPVYTSAYRYYNDDVNTEEIEQTVFDRHLVGMSSTYPASVSGYITDSAAGATALASGVKTYNGAIGLDANKQEVLTVLEYAKQKGLKTGVAVTSQVNHATPASYLTHNENRRNYNDIADSYIDNGIKADLILGGGTVYFKREDRDLVNEFKQNGFSYIDSYKQLSELTKSQPALGLFAPVGLPWALDDETPTRLLAMTKTATRVLDNDQGYFLLVEASQVDWAGHSNDVASAMAEMKDLAVTMEYLETYSKNNPDTLVVLTADHSTGGFTIAANGEYAWRPEILHKLTQSPHAIGRQLANIEISAATTNSLFNFELNAEEIAQLKTVKQQHKGKETEAVEKAMYVATKKLLDARTNTGWTTSGHTGHDVPVFAFGPGSELFKGHIDNTQVADNIFKLLGK